MEPQNKNIEECWSIKLPLSLRDPDLIAGVGYAVLMLIRGEDVNLKQSKPVKTTRIRLSPKAYKYAQKALELGIAKNKTELIKKSLTWLAFQPEYMRKTRI